MNCWLRGHSTTRSTEARACTSLLDPSYEKCNNCCRYTEKLLRIGKRLPAVLQKIIPSKQLDKLVLVERCWNCFPRVKTTYDCPFSKDFAMSVDTVCIDDDAGCAEEGASLSPQEKADCKVEMLDIFSIDKDQYRADEDPTKVGFARAASRGPLVKASEPLTL